MRENIDFQLLRRTLILFMASGRQCAIPGDHKAFVPALACAILGDDNCLHGVLDGNAERLLHYAGPSQQRRRRRCLITHLTQGADALSATERAFRNGGATAPGLTPDVDANRDFALVGDVLFYQGRPMRNDLTRRIAEIAREGGDTRPLIRFARAIMGRTSPVVKKLYPALMRRGYALTSEGRVVAYVRGIDVGDSPMDAFSARGIVQRKDWHRLLSLSLINPNDIMAVPLDTDPVSVSHHRHLIELSPDSRETFERIERRVRDNLDVLEQPDAETALKDLLRLAAQSDERPDDESTAANVRCALAPPCDVVFRDSHGHLRIGKIAVEMPAGQTLHQALDSTLRIEPIAVATRSLIDAADIGLNMRLVEGEDISPDAPRRCLVIDRDYVVGEPDIGEDERSRPLSVTVHAVPQAAMAAV